MIDPKSRYHPRRPFDSAPDAQERFEGVPPRDIGPATPVIEHEVVRGDRLDLLARHYYNDARLWWRIVDANPRFIYAGDLTVESMRGERILIPRETEST